jgi:hypothetical protein
MAIRLRKPQLYPAELRAHMEWLRLPAARLSEPHDSADRHFRTEPRRGALFRADRRDRIELRGLARGVDGEGHADQRA